MRKFLVSLLIVVFISSCAFVESFGFSEIDNAELLSVYEDIKSELLNRGLVPSTLYPGKYEAGVAIAPGNYVLTYRNDNNDRTAVRVMQDVGESNLKIISELGFSKNGEQKAFSIGVGQILNISGSGEFEIAIQ